MTWTRLGTSRRNWRHTFFRDENENIVIEISDVWTDGKGSKIVWSVSGAHHLAHINRRFETREEAVAYVEGLEDGEKGVLLNQISDVRIADLIRTRTPR